MQKNGRQAVEYFESNSPGTFDAILMDVMMPVMDGIAATKAIRAMDRADAKTIPIIAMTANAFEEDAKRMSRSRYDRTSGETFPDRRCGENYCGVLWKVMPSARSIAISKLSEAASKLIFVPIKIQPAREARALQNQSVPEYYHSHIPQTFRLLVLPPM